MQLKCVEEHKKLKYLLMLMRHAFLFLGLRFFPLFFLLLGGGLRCFLFLQDFFI
jgi:hypothetical protein